MHNKFEINQTKIKGGCQSGRKVVTHKSKIDLPPKTIGLFFLGVNKYQLEKEDQIDVLMIDNELVRKQQIERLSKVKRERDENKAQLCLENLTEAAKNQLNDTENGNNCLAAAVECARARCTVGEITDAMAKVIFRKNKKNKTEKTVSP